MLVDAAGQRVGRAVGINGVFGNLGVAGAPIVTAFLAAWLGWRWAFIVPGVLCIASGLLYLREGAVDSAQAKAAGKPFPEIPRAVVRRAVGILLCLAVAAGFIFNAFTLLLPKLIEERLAGSPDLLPVVGVLAFVVTICGGLTQFTVGKLIDRNTLKTVLLPLGLIQAPGLLLQSARKQPGPYRDPCPYSAHKRRHSRRGEHYHRRRPLLPRLSTEQHQTDKPC
jgi:nitrate/nitrite transporter NarK